MKVRNQIRVGLFNTINEALETITIKFHIRPMWRPIDDLVFEHVKRELENHIQDNIR